MDSATHPAESQLCHHRLFIVLLDPERFYQYGINSWKPSYHRIIFHVNWKTRWDIKIAEED
jgi:hypothetical protein